ncbi:MAG TPA: mannose-1-phosphate guanylyltransferase [Candidatus Acidoferrales bacterium]|nr:mannose-1-phosphate guanylyltransferase [Candidatus Acidoferrales bacterium]HEV2340477.1 mannose-1-phosphate guanylyltransferase [Candidatus Acidoferrales bacterium]
MKNAAKFPACAVILAGGRGTRFWPRSRKRTPKQLLDIVSAKTMLRETAERLTPLFSPRQIWVVTNEEQAAAVRRELPRMPREQILAEPVGRNTAAATGLVATHFAKIHGDAVMAVLPADHYIADAARFRRIAKAAMELARRQGNLVVLGIPPTRQETGFGYIQRAGAAGRVEGVPAYIVRRFTEKPALAAAKRYVASGRYFWNAGMFFWRVSTYFECLRKFLPETYRALGELQQHVGMPTYEQALARIYPPLENISVDYAVMEPATRPRGQERVYVLPAKIGWSDIGSWAAVYELLTAKKGANVSAGSHLAHDASGNFFWSPKKFVAAIGVHNLVVVETDDALLICPRERAQDVGKIVKWLEEKKHPHLL